MLFATFHVLRWIAAHHTTESAPIQNVIRFAYVGELIVTKNEKYKMVRFCGRRVVEDIVTACENSAHKIIRRTRFSLLFFFTFLLLLRLFSPSGVYWVSARTTHR